MKIIHTADIHLDSKMESNLPTAAAKRRKSELLLSFLELVDYAIKNEVTAVIIAGDLFDTGRISSVTADTVLKKIEEASGIDFLYLQGNHDNGKSLISLETPSNLKFFSNKWTSFQYGNVVISGAEINNENYGSIYGSLLLDGDNFNIVTLHGGVSTSSGEDLVNIKELANKNIDYLALGHYHSYSEGEIDRRGIWCYSGCLEGRGFDECGDKGFVVLNIDENGFKKEFIKSSHRDILTVDADITGLNNAGDILKKVEQSVQNIDESAMVKVVLTGNIPLDARKDLNLIKETLDRKFFFSKVSDKTRISINPDEFKNDISLKGEFIRLCLLSEMSEEERDRVIECGIAALSSMEVL